MDPQSSSSSASSSMSRRNYCAFLSFRGVDTRPTIISHFYRALCQKGVYTFKDSEELEAGQRRSELFDAIEGSRVAIITFSEKYALSKWCLDELQKIMEYKGQGKLTVIPIFYHVSPREVRMHEKENGDKGCYQIAMEEMEAKYDSETVKRWRKALWEGGDLIGIEVVSGQDEGDVVQDVVERVTKIVNRVPLEVAKHPVGIDRHLTEIRRSLRIDPHVDDVFMVGLLGPGGAGKTTLSKAICNDIADRFDSWCFLPNVRERSSRVSNGLAQLQQELLQELLSDKNMEVSIVDMGKTLIKERLCEKRVLIILDDVEESIQLDALAGDLNWFGRGSRIILTTRNEHALAANKVPKYEVNLLARQEAVDLFRRHAFGTQDKINIDCSLIDRFVEYAGNLPLALVVLGASLRDRSKFEWEGKLTELKESPDEVINAVLKISYDGLEKKHKELFLDVACLFKGMDMDEVVKILDGCGFAASLGLTRLRQRCLITIVDQEIEMHDLLVEMGRSISCDNGHGIPSRIWLYEDFWKILSDERSAQERRVVEGIVLYDGSENDDRLVKFNAWKDFKKLRILIIVGNVVCPEETLQLPRDLRWLAWSECSAPAIEFYQSSELVYLDLQHSEIKQIKAMGLEKLKYLNLSECCSLETLPDLSSCRDLEDLNLSRCYSLTRLEKIKATVKNVTAFKFFLLLFDEMILHLPFYLLMFWQGLEKLKYLNLSYCRSLETLPDLSSCRDLEVLKLFGCNRLSRLQKIKATGLEKLKYLNLSECSSLETLPDLSRCRELKDLNLSNCYGLTRLQKIKTTRLEKLKCLNLSNCRSLETLPDLSRCRDLEDLNLSWSYNLMRLDEAIGSLKNLVHLNLRQCRNLATVPSSLRSKRLKTLDLTGCLNVKKIPAIMEKNEFLEVLPLTDTAVKELPDSIGNLVALKELYVDGCMELTVIPSSIYKMRALHVLRLEGCWKLSGFPRRAAGAATDVYGFPNLKSLTITYCELKDLEFLDDLTCFETLTSLALSGNKFTNVPASISKFKNLQMLRLNRCDRLVEVPELPNVPYRNVAEWEWHKWFRVDLSNSRSLDSGSIQRFLSLENVRGSVGAMSVTFPGEDFPHWVKLQFGEYDTCYQVSLPPKEMLEDDLFGLALFISFSHDPSSPNESIWDCAVQVRVNRKLIISDFHSEVVGVHSWCVYIPCQSLVQRRWELNRLDITLKISACYGFEIRRWGMRLLRKREEEDDLIKVLEDGDDDDDSPGLEELEDGDDDDDDSPGYSTRTLRLRLRVPEMNPESQRRYSIGGKRTVLKGEGEDFQLGAHKVFMGLNGPVLR